MREKVQSWISDPNHSISSGVFVMGLGILFMTGNFWPGILFVFGASAVAQGIVEGRKSSSFTSAFWCFALGLIFSLGFGGRNVIGIVFVLWGVYSVANALKLFPSSDETSCNESQEASAAASGCQQPTSVVYAKVDLTKKPVVDNLLT